MIVDINSSTEITNAYITVKIVNLADSENLFLSKISFSYSKLSLRTERI